MSFAEVPELKNVRDSLASLLGTDKAPTKGWVAEGNHYFLTKTKTKKGKAIMQSGIGWHTDSERTMVVGVRFGKPFLLAFQKFSKFSLGKAMGEPLKINLGHGDVYVMSEAAVRGNSGNKEYVIKHCAGNKECIGFE